MVELYTVDATFKGTVTILSGNTWTVLLKREKNKINEIFRLIQVKINAKNINDWKNLNQLNYQFKFKIKKIIKGCILFIKLIRGTQDKMGNFF